MTDRTPTPSPFNQYLSNEVEKLRSSHQQLSEGLAYQLNELAKVREVNKEIANMTILGDEALLDKIISLQYQASQQARVQRFLLTVTSILAALTIFVAIKLC